METPPPTPTAAKLTTGRSFKDAEREEAYGEIHSTIEVRAQQLSSVSANITTTTGDATDAPTGKGNRLTPRRPLPTRRKRKLQEDVPTIAQDSVRSSDNGRHFNTRKHARHNRQIATSSRDQAQGQRTAASPVTASQTLRPPSPAATANEARHRESPPAARIPGIEEIAADTEKSAETIVCKTTTIVAPPPKPVSKIRWGRAHRDVERIHSDEDVHECVAVSRAPSYDNACKLEIQDAQYGADAMKTPESIAVEVKLAQPDDAKDDSLQDVDGDPAQNDNHDIKDLDPKQQQTPIIIDLTGEPEPEHEPPTIIDLTVIDSPVPSNASIAVPESSHRTSNAPPQQISEQALLLTLVNVLCQPMKTDDHAVSKSVPKHLPSVAQQALKSPVGNEPRPADVAQRDSRICNSIPNSESRSTVPPPPRLRFIDLVTSPGTPPLSNALARPDTSHSSFVSGSESQPASSDHSNSQYHPSPISSSPHYSQAPDKSVLPNNGAIPSIASSKPRLTDTHDWGRHMPTFPIRTEPIQPLANRPLNAPLTNFNKSAVSQDVGPISSYMPPIIDRSKCPGLRPPQKVNVAPPSRSPEENGPVPAGSGGLGQHQHRPLVQHYAPQSQREPVITQQLAPAVAINSQCQQPAARQLTSQSVVEKPSMPPQFRSVIATTTNPQYQQIPAQFSAPQRAEPMPMAQQQSRPVIAKDQPYRQIPAQRASQWAEAMSLLRPSQPTVLTNNQQFQQPTAQQHPTTIQQGEPPSATRQFGPVVPTNVHQQSTSAVQQNTVQFHQNAIHQQNEVSQSIPDTPASNPYPRRANKTPPVSPYEAHQLQRIFSGQAFRSSTTSINTSAIYRR